MAALLAAFQRQPPGFHFVDVGANMGLYSAICAVMFEPGRVVAFEPTPEVAEMARRVLAANGIARTSGESSSAPSVNAWEQRRCICRRSRTRRTLWWRASSRASGRSTSP